MAPLHPQDVDLLLGGPSAVGLSLSSPEARHDRLRALWAAHGDDIRAEAERRRIEAIWFEERDWFVALIRGERSDEQ